MQPHKTAIYQIDPYLFRDSEGHGWGTLDGIIEKLDYLQWLGITHLWILPFFRNAGRDGGYDIVDHCAIDPRLGDEAAFARLVAAARARDIGVIVELVMQHTSELHPWFQAARAGHADYADRYLWRDEPPSDPPSPLFPPMEASVWTWDGYARRYYRHMFYAHEPDLDLGQASVRDEMARIMRYWLERGVCGFRVDAVSFMIKSACGADPRDDGLWLLEDMRRLVAEYRHDPVLIGEADVKADEYHTYLSDDRRLSHLLDFHLNNHIFLALAREDAGEIVRTLEEYGPHASATQRIAWLRNNDELDLDQLEPEEREEVMQRYAPNPQMRLYDRGIRRRLASMLDGNADALAMAHALLLSLGQVPVLRYGEEIGLGDDQALPERLAVRVPMHWDDGPGAGFSDPPERAWRKPRRDGPFGYARVNVAAQRQAPSSLLHDVRELLQSRRALPQFEQIPHCLAWAPTSVLALRFPGPTEDLLVVVNVAAGPAQLDVSELSIGRTVLARHCTLDGNTLQLAGYGYAWLTLAS
ncbi:MAG TPA: alpha-amylase family glycosyl hydrolase [Stenotrophomonas sp.]|jgi:maltose alpha-D-glucosyltransferase/alpha-amylase